MFNIFSKLLDSNEKQLDRISKIVDQINKIDDKKYTLNSFPKSSDELKKKAKSSLKEILKKDEITKDDIKIIRKSLDEILPKAFNMVRKASEMVANHRHFDVQLMAGIALYEGRLIELGTGEGKTLVATLPLYLYSLLGLGANIVTVNDYLARRDGEWCGHIYYALGLTTGVVTSAGSYKFIKDLEGIRSEEEIKEHKGIVPKLNQMHGFNLVECTKKEAYACDITYCTNNEIGFDYLRDNMNVNLDDMVLRKFFFCIVDEADSILIDESRTPLIISAPAMESNNLYVTFAQVANSLKKDTDYTVDEKQRKVIITDAGIDRVEKMLNVKNLWEDFLLAHHLENALSAKELFKNGDEYILKDGQVLIVDEFTGRLMEGRRFSEGVHQAIEAKEGVDIKEESRTMATITFQNLFRLFPILGGMTGTALTEAEEFSKIYNIDVIVIPPNKKLIRVDNNDVIFKTEAAKFNAVIDEIKDKHAKGQPVLVGTISVDKSEKLSDLLSKQGLKHEVLNAKYHEKEAEIVSMAGQKGQITISTNMAGRGTDITLGEGVREAGGLAIIGTERHESRRIDNQLRGRSGRQGDPGESRFYISLDDNLMRIFGGERVSSIMTSLKFDENIPLEFGIFSRQIESAQKKVESMYFDMRKHLVEYDDVLNIQREIIYKRRRFVLSLFNVRDDKFKSHGAERKEYIIEKVSKQIESIIDLHSQDGELDDIDFETSIKETEEIIPNSLLEQVLKKAATTKEEWIKLLRISTDKKRVNSDKLKEQYSFVLEEAYDICEQTLSPEIFADKSKMEMLRVMDILWVEHLDAIEALKEGIGMSVYSQKDPLVEYKNQAYILFQELIGNIEYQISRVILKIDNVQIILNPQENIQTNKEQIEGVLSEEKVPVMTLNREREAGPKVTSKATIKIGRNDLCPCGSGKKYKKCGEINSPEHQARMAKRI